MARELIATYFFPAKGTERYVVFVNGTNGSGAHAEIDPPANSSELRRFFSATSNAACQFKLPVGAIAKVEVYRLHGHDNKLRYHDVQILNSCKHIGDSDSEEVKAQLASMFGDSEASSGGIQGICSNFCDGSFVQVFDCENILTMTLDCDSGLCSSGGGGELRTGENDD